MHCLQECNVQNTGQKSCHGLCSFLHSRRGVDITQRFNITSSLWWGTAGICGRFADNEAPELDGFTTKGLKLAFMTRPECFISRFESCIVQWKSQKFGSLPKPQEWFHLGFFISHQLAGSSLSLRMVGQSNSMDFGEAILRSRVVDEARKKVFFC